MKNFPVSRDSETGRILIERVNEYTWTDTNLHMLKDSVEANHPTVTSVNSTVPLQWLPQQQV